MQIKNKQLKILKKMSLLCVLFVNTVFSSANFSYDNFDFSLSGIYKPEVFYGTGLSRFNTNDGLDRICFWRHTLDFNFDSTYGMDLYDHIAAEFYFTLRNKAVWGSPENILRTIESTVKLAEVVDGSHTHGIPRHLFWIREAWLYFDLADVLSLSFKNVHTFTIGLFPYQLGRGIALGDAYAVGPESLGFFTDFSVDQYAYGALLSNEIIKDTFTTDLYVALLQNKSAFLSEVNAKIRGQEFGKLNAPERGFGRINFLTSGRLNWTVFDDEIGNLTVEGYGLYNHDPEQYVEFPADATAHLGTMGIAAEYTFKRFEGGFEYALNRGHQHLRGWDRNETAFENRKGSLMLVNTHVHVGSATGSLALYEPKSDTQKAINEAFRGAEYNGQQIGDPSLSLFNGERRFRNPRSRKFTGWMFVTDGAYWIIEKELQIAFTGAIASGEDNPVKDAYHGFIGLQEMYAGIRVRSAFELGSAGKTKRFLTHQTENEEPDDFIFTPVDGFTNLIMVGTGVTWKKDNVKKPFNINPNILVFWQETQTGRARNFLGVETNLFTNCKLLKNLDFFTITTVFFPGGHYTDRKGIPALDRQQLQIIDEPDVTGYTADPIPKYSDNIAFTLNMGMKYTF